VHAGLIEAIPSEPVACHTAPNILAVIVEHVVFAGDVVNRQVSAPDD
jgi:hypothetical protein